MRHIQAIAPVCKYVHVQYIHVHMYIQYKSVRFIQNSGLSDRDEDPERDMVA